MCCFCSSSNCSRVTTLIRKIRLKAIRGARVLGGITVFSAKTKGKEWDELRKRSKSWKEGPSMSQVYVLLPKRLSACSLKSKAWLNADSQGKLYFFHSQKVCSIQKGIRLYPQFNMNWKVSVKKKKKGKKKRICITTDTNIKSQ